MKGPLAALIETHRTLTQEEISDWADAIESGLVTFSVSATQEAWEKIEAEVARRAQIRAVES